ncbi:MAG: efflux transporter outer membrane subunit [Chlamydiia bacterium]
MSLFLLNDCAWDQKVDPRVEVYQEAPVVSPLEEKDQTPFAIGFWPSTSWWEIFNDPCLDYCIRVAIDNNPDLLVAKSRVEEAYNVAMREGGPRWFQAELNGSAFISHLSKYGLYRTLNSTIPANGDLIDLTGVVSYEVDIWGKNYERYMAAVNLFQSSEAKSFFVEVDVSTRVAEVYFILQSLDAQIEKLGEWMISEEEIVALSKQLLKNRIINKIQLESIKQDLEGLKKDWEALTTARQIQRHLLAILMGMGPDTEIPVGRNFLEPMQKLSIPTTLSLGLLKRRPDLAADIHYLKSLEREIKIARTLFYPDINIIASGGVESFTAFNVFSPQSLQGALLPSFSLPLFTGFRLKGNLGVKIKAYEAGVHQYNANVLKASQEVKDIVSQLEGIVLTIGYQNNLIEEEAIKLDLTERLYLNRILSKIQLDKEKNALYQKWITMYNLYRERYQYHVRLIRALGGGYLDGKREVE